jgi:hypothetical protein
MFVSVRLENNEDSLRLTSERAYLVHVVGKRARLEVWGRMRRLGWLVT